MTQSEGREHELGQLCAFVGTVKIYAQAAFAVNWYDVYAGPFRIGSIGRNKDTGRYFRPGSFGWFDSLEAALKDFAQTIAINVEESA